MSKYDDKAVGIYGKLHEGWCSLDSHTYLYISKRYSHSLHILGYVNVVTQNYIINIGECLKLNKY